MRLDSCIHGSLGSYRDHGELAKACSDYPTEVGTMTVLFSRLSINFIAVGVCHG